MGGDVDVEKPASFQASARRTRRAAGRYPSVRRRNRWRALPEDDSAGTFRQPWDGGFRFLGRYLETVDCASVKPSLRSSPWIRGASSWDLHDAFSGSGHEPRLRSLAAPGVASDSSTASTDETRVGASGSRSPAGQGPALGAIPAKSAKAMTRSESQHAFQRAGG